MSEADVNLIRDEDVLRRMWQQTEDFGRKKEIRAHMYRLREERLRNLYSPEPTPAKGCEISSGQAHVNSFADQTFQSMKSKEVRDAGSPPKEFNYRGQDLKEMSNAGWNVESEDKVTDDGRTHVKSVNANIEGKYDVEGGKGQFTAVDRQRQAVTEYQDDNTKMRRDDSSYNTATHEHVARQTDDGTRFSSTTSSSNSSSKFQQVSSTVHETPAIQDYDQAAYDTNRNEKVTRITNTEQNLRSNDFQNGELVSRKIDYPDDNTKVIVETRCLPDGTRVTSTRREFRVPAQSTRSEHQTRSESKSYSTQQRSDTRESSSKTIRHTTDSRLEDIVDSQRHVDDNDFKKQLREYTVDDDANSETHRTNRRHDTKFSKVVDQSNTEDDFSQTRYETRVNNKVIDRSTNVRDDYTQVHQRYAENVDQTDRREVIETHDDTTVSYKDAKKTHRVTSEKIRNLTDEPAQTLRDTDEPVRNVQRLTDEPSRIVPKDTNEPGRKIPRDTNERVHSISDVTDERTDKIARATKVEENVERKTSTDQYQTTYQNDYQQRKVSNDLSPTHQAWASTLRADTPSTTRPSTRASSPGSRTFKSSTSSLRSSVSPDKTFKKPSSRGGSPNKVDRCSPTRSVTSDRYSSTHSSHSVTEVRTNKHTSPERKPPTGRSPAGFSPERKPQDISFRQRPSVSPEKRPDNFPRKSVSPERKPSHKKPSDGFPKNTSPTRAAGLPSAPRQSPEKQLHQPSGGRTSLDTGYPSPTSPQRSNTSPDRKPIIDNSKPAFPRTSPSPDRKKPNGSKKPEASPERDVGYGQPTPLREPQDSTKKTSVSPDRKPSYMSPTVASQPSSDTRSPSKPGDKPGDSSLNEPSQSPDHKHSKTVIQVKEDHYKFIDEETKINTRTDITNSVPLGQAPSPNRKSPSKDSHDFTKSPLPKGRSPSPQKKTIIVTENDELYGRIDKSVELVDVSSTHDKQTVDNRSMKRTPKDTPETKGIPSRENSPTKFGTYDKKKSRDVTETTEVTTVTSTKDVKYDSLKSRDKTSPKKAPEPTSPNKKSHRESTSPVKSPTRETKYKNTTDFISTERTSEEVNKKTVKKERSRQLHIPSSSPTRKPMVETEPSTGQSSPTTSVSGFVYFGSPQTERPIVTDLDENFEPITVYPDEPQYTRPESLDLTRSTSPSKIPCRSPSPEKRDSPTKESLPRKSSLKKPSNFVNPASPMDKPPSNFRVSPTEDKPDTTGHKVVKKDNPAEPEVSSPIRTKPPLTRRETYEDRCRLILGMVDTNTIQKVTKETKKTEKPESDKSSPSVSPCESPITQKSSPFPEFTLTQKKTVNTKTDVTDFIAKEKEDIIKTTKIREHKSKIPSRESSPTKLQDIFSKTTTITQIDTQQKDEDVINTVEAKNQSPRQSPEKINRRPSESPKRQVRQKITDDVPLSKLPQTETFDTYPRGSSPTMRPRFSVSPEHKPSLHTRESPDKQPVNKTPKGTSPTRGVVTTTSSNQTTKTDSSDFNTISSTEDVQKEYTRTTMKERSPRTRVLESPTRQTPTFSPDHPSTEPSTKPRPVSGSPSREHQSPNRTFKTQPYIDSPKQKPEDQFSENKLPSKPRDSPEKIPGYMKTTTAISSKYDTVLTSEDIEEVCTSTVDEKHKITKTSVSPTRKTIQDAPRSVSPSKPTHSSTRVPKNERSPERKPSKDAPLKSPDSKDLSPRDLPGYMRTTASITSKTDINTENINETITSKTYNQKHPTSRPSDSSNRNVTAPRTPSPTKFTHQPSFTSPKKADTSPLSKQPSSRPKDDVPKRPKETPKDRSPTRPVTDKTPSYMKTTTSVSSKYETDEYAITSEDTKETITSKATERKYLTSRESPTRESQKPIDKSSSDYLRSVSPSRPKEDTPKRSDVSPERDPQDKYNSFPTCKTVEYRKTTSDLITQFDSTSTEDFETSSLVQKIYPTEPTNVSPIKKAISPELKPSHPSSLEDTVKVPHDKPTEKSISSRPSVSPDRKPSYMKPTASVTSKHETTTITTDVQEKNTLDNVEYKHSSTRKSPTRQSPKNTPTNFLPKPEEPRQLRTPSPTKKTVKVTEVSTDFLMSERKQEILDRVHKSLRKLSPERTEKSPSREKSPNKTRTRLFDLDITTESFETDDMTEILKEHTISEVDVTHPKKPKDDKAKNLKIPSKPSSRNLSPIKRAPSAPTSSQLDKGPESPTKSRSISPRKPLTQTDRPQSPHGARASGIRPRDQVPFNRKPTPATLSTYKIERITTDVKKTNGVTKQNVSKTTTTSKSTTSRLVSPQTTRPSESELKRIPAPKGIKENVCLRKETVTRTSSDSNIKPKSKITPQRIKSKPEIQVNDLSTKSPKYQKPIIKEPYSNLPTKPKSATALNTSTDDDDDMIIDVQQSKSSRENSPDRICPTPVNCADDVGTPRFPDEVSEPDDEYRRRTYHTIHETESVVDDIVEICEDEELFVKKTDVSAEYDDSLLSVNDKVSKFTTKIESVTKPKGTTSTFKDTERRVHSDFIDENVKSDECLLSVSEKVNKFAKGPRDTKDNRSPSRKITDEYDKNTIYQDDYTKLSVNDKAHLFVETAENINVPKVKLAQKVDRPDLSNVDESLKKDDCLLSVSDKVNKFVKTAENFLTETHEVDQKEKKIKDQHEKIMRQIIDEDDDDETYEMNESTTTVEKKVNDCDDKPKSYKIEATSQPKGKDYGSPKSKTTERIPVVKITTLRSSEAVKKAKALFENIASTQKTKDVTQITAKTTKLTDIGVVKKSPKTDSTIVLHPSIEDMSQKITEVDSELDTKPLTPRTSERPASGTLTRPHHPHVDEKPRASPNRLTAQSPEVPRAKSPMRQSVEITTTKTVLSKYPGAPRAESPRNRPESPRHRPESEKPDKVPGYLRPTKTSQIKEETKVVEESEVSSRRGSGKFGVELRRTSIERSTISSERRRSVEHHQPCIEDIYDLDLLEQMLEKVVGYEQRRRIRSQIRIVKNDTEQIETHTHIKTKHTTSATKSKAPEHHTAKSPERVLKSTPQKTLSPDRQGKTPQRTYPERSHPKEPSAPVINGHAKEPVKTTAPSRLRPHSPEKLAPKSIRSAKSPARQPSPVKKRTVSPTKTTPKPKANRFNEYASAYMKKVGLNEADKAKFTDKKTKKTTDTGKTVSHEIQDRTSQEFTTTKSFTSTSERTSSRDVIEIVQVNGKRSSSPEKITGILRKPQSPERRANSPLDKAFSPERDHSPVNRAPERSPERRVYSPVGKTHAPERRVPSPERRVYSPVSKPLERKAHSPERRVYSPLGKTHVPERKAHSPERRVYSPANKAPERTAQSPERKVHSPERKAQSPERRVISPAERLYQRSPSPEFKKQKSDTKKEAIIKTVYDIEKKIPTKLAQDEKPSWVMNRNLKKITSETRTFSSKKMEAEKTKYRVISPSKVISKPIDVITSSYGPGPVDADGKPLFGIKALRNGATNFQVKGTVIRQEFHSRNGGEPEGTVSVTAYSSQPEELEQLLTSQGVEPPSRLHGLSAITTTKKFGGDTGISMSSVNTKEERASLEHFTHTDRKMESQVDNQETCFNIREESSDFRQIDSSKSDRTDRNDRRREERVTEVRKGQMEEKREKLERREDKKTVRQSSVKSLTEKFIKSANDSGKPDRSKYPKAGLILRTTSTIRDSVSSDEAHPGLARTDSEHSIGSVDDVVVTTTTDRGGAVTTTTRTSSHHGPTTTHQRTSTVTHHEPIITTKKTTTVITGSQEPVATRVVTQGPVTKTVTGQAAVTEKSFLDSTTKVTGVQDILTRMKNADIVIEDGDTTEDSEARALLNKFLGATVLMAGMQNYVTEQPTGKLITKQETVRTSSGKVTSTRVEDLDLDQCWDERLLRKLLDECTDYEQRRRLRARIRSLMAEQEACAAAVTDALGAAHITSQTDGANSGAADTHEEEEVTVTSSVRRDSSEKTSSSSFTKTSKVTESVSGPAPKPVSPFAKFRQLEKQNSTNSPNSPKTPQSPGSSPQPYFKFTDPALQCSALTIKERLLQWCRDKTRDYENVKLENFSTSWADGLAFCALIHHFLPKAFDYSKLTAEHRRHNFTLAFKVADEKAGIYPLLDVDDMVTMRKPDWKCVFTYVQSIYRRFKDEV